MRDEFIGSEIDHWRMMVHAHSILYYQLNNPIISDAAFDYATDRLLRLQWHYPEVSADPSRYRTDLFHKWNGNTGMHFVTDEHIQKTIDRLLSLPKEKEK